MIENIREVPGFPDYLISDNGVIWTTKRKGGNDRKAGQKGPPRLLKINICDGYPTVSLVLNGKAYSKKVHTLVLEAFVGPRPTGMEACHYPDETRTNIHISNLRWDTPLENAKDRYRDHIHLTEKKCRRCGEVKPKSEFYSDKRAGDKLKTECKSCHTKIAIFTRDPEKKRKANRESMRRVRSLRPLE